MYFFAFQSSLWQVVVGFSNWKDATVSFRNHESSSFHKEAVMVMVTLPSTTPDVGKLLSKQCATDKQNNRHCLFEIIRCIRFLCRQGLALRCDDDDQDGNLN